MEQIDDATNPNRHLHIILDNLQTHKAPEGKAWLEDHPYFHLYFIPTSSSWLNAVERLFRDLTTQRSKRGVFKNVEALEDALIGWLNARNAIQSRSNGPRLWRRFSRRSVNTNGFMKHYTSEVPLFAREAFGVGSVGRRLDLLECAGRVVPSYQTNDLNRIKPRALTVHSEAEKVLDALEGRESDY